MGDGVDGRGDAAEVGVDQLADVYLESKAIKCNCIEYIMINSIKETLFIVFI